MLALKLFLLSLSVLNSHFLESVVVAFVVVEFLLVKMDDLVACHVEELTGVGNDDDCALAVCDVVLKPHNCVQV